jgi:hypothetical protein
MTMRKRNFSGFWGWRNVAGIFDVELSTEYARRRALVLEPDRPMVLDSNPDIARDYARSGWFIIDLLSTVPWGLLAESFSPLTSLRLLRLLRLTRVFRVLRLTKAIYLIEKIRRAVPSVPSIERLIFIAMSLPWIAHMLACLVYYFEHLYGTSSPTYSGSFHAMWMAIIARKTLLGDQISYPTFFLSMVGVVISVFVLASVTGNLAALYTSIDFGDDENHQVVLQDHSVIVGWNHTVFSVIRQLLASERDADGTPGDIVLLSNRTDAEVWREFDEFGLSFDPRRLTVHTGSIHSVHNIRKLSVGRARNVILLGQRHDDARGDSERLASRRADVDILKTLLASCNAFGADEWARAGRRGRGHLSVVAAVHSRRVAHILQRGIPQPEHVKGMLDVFIVDVEDILSRCIAQVASEPILSELFRELFSYTHAGEKSGGLSHEIYVVEATELLDTLGRPVHLDDVRMATGRDDVVFDDLFAAMPRAVPIGFYASPSIIPEEMAHLYAGQQRARSTARTRALFLNPGHRSDERAELIEVGFERDHALTRGDAIVVIAPSRDAARVIDLRGLAQEEPEEFTPSQVDHRPTRRIIVLGNGGKVPEVLGLLPDLLPRGSHVVTEAHATLDADARHLMSSRDISIERVSMAGLDAFSEVEVDEDVEGIDLAGCDTVVVMSGEDDRHRHDANILMTLTELESRHEQDRGWAERAHVIELLDAHNVELADAFGQVASLISPELVSNYLVQVANDPERGLVYTEFLDIEGNEFYVVDVGRYLAPEADHATFGDVMCRARSCGEVAVGYIWRDAQARERLRLCPVGPHRDTPLSELEARVGERVERIVVVAPRFPESGVES